MAADNVNMQLRNDVADAGNIYFFRGKVAFNEFGDGVNMLLHVGLLLNVQFMELGFLCRRNENEPGS